MSVFYQTVRTSLRIFFSLCYSLKIEGKEHLPQGAALIAANHASYYDPPVLGVALGEEPLYVMIHSLDKKPLFGRMLRALHAYPIGEAGDDKGTLRKILHALHEGKKVVIFPEGRRSPDGKLLPLQPGVAALALRTGAPIIPTWIEGTYAVWNRHKRFPHLGGTLTCRFGQPISPLLLGDRDKQQKKEVLLSSIVQSWENLSHES